MFVAGFTRDALSFGSSRRSDQNATLESRAHYYTRRGAPETVACNVIPPAGTRSHLDNIMTSSSSPSPPLFAVYSEALAWLRQLHAMCARADAPFPLPLPPMASPEPAYYVTKMAAGAAPMQPFDPRWASCPSPSTAPCVDPPTARDPPGRGGRVGGRGRDFSIPSILSHAGPSSTGADSDGTTESEERCQSTSSSLDDVCGSVMTSRRRVMTSYDSVQRARVDSLSHQRRRQHDKQQFECPECNKVSQVANTVVSPNDCLIAN